MVAFLMASVHRNRAKTGWIVRWRDASHKPHWKTVPGPKANALKVARDIEQRQALGPLYEAPAETLGGFLAGWLERYKQRVRESTYLRRVDALRALGMLDEREEVRGGDASSVIPERSSPSSSRPGTHPGQPAEVRHSKARPRRLSRSSSLSSNYLQNLTTAEVEDALSALAARAPRQAQIALASLKLALKSARRRGQRFDVSILEIEANRYDEREPRFLTLEEQQEIASRMPEPIKRIVPVAGVLGLRMSELFDLKEDDLDLDHGTLHVRAGKTKASRRTVTLPPMIVGLLREQLLARRHTGDKLVFPAPQGGRMRKDNFGHRFFRPAARQAGFQGVRFHDLRHSAASLMMAAGWNIKEIAEQLGHADGGRLILMRYGHLQAGARKRAATELETYLRSLEPTEEDSETGA
jgi:integrase